MLKTEKNKKETIFPVCLYETTIRGARYCSQMQTNNTDQFEIK